MSNTLFFPAAIWWDNYPLTDQGREPVQVQRDERSVGIELASGKRKRYIKAIKKKFSLSWSWLPDEASDTIDGGYARRDIQNLIGETGDTHTITYWDRNGGHTNYTCFVNSYQETLIRRDPTTGIHFWQVQIELEEQ